jgi:hypothetical protein
MALWVRTPACHVTWRRTLTITHWARCFWCSLRASSSRRLGDRGSLGARGCVALFHALLHCRVGGAGRLPAALVDRRPRDAGAHDAGRAGFAGHHVGGRAAVYHGHRTRKHQASRLALASRAAARGALLWVCKLWSDFCVVERHDAWCASTVFAIQLLQAIEAFALMMRYQKAPASPRLDDVVLSSIA